MLAKFEALMDSYVKNSEVVQSYWNHSVSLIPLMMREKRAAINGSGCKQNWKQGDTKINIASRKPLQTKKFQKFWVPEYFLYRCILIKIQPNWSTVIFTSKYSFAAEPHLTIFFWQSTAKETSRIFVACFLVVKIMLISAKIQHLTVN